MVHIPAHAFELAAFYTAFSGAAAAANSGPTSALYRFQFPTGIYCAHCGTTDPAHYALERFPPGTRVKLRRPVNAAERAMIGRVDFHARKDPERVAVSWRYGTVAQAIVHVNNLRMAADSE